MTDLAQAHFSALAALRSGGDAAAAHRAAASSLRPGGVLDWLEHGIAIHAVASAISEYSGEQVAAGRMTATELMQRVNDILERREQQAAE